MHEAPRKLSHLTLVRQRAAIFAKRHYEVIATAMQDAHPGAALSADNRAVTQWHATVKELANSFARDNGMFKRERFINACQPGANVRART